MVFFFQAEDGIRYLVRSRGLGDVYKRQGFQGLVSGRMAIQIVELLEAVDIEQHHRQRLAAGAMQPDLLVEKRQHAAPVADAGELIGCLLYTSPSPRDRTRSRMPSSA